MSITRAQIGGFGANQKLTSAVANAMDLNSTFALDKRSGQTDTLASTITLTGSITAATGALIELQNGAVLQLDAGAVLNLFGQENLQSGSVFRALSGSTMEFQSGSTFQIDPGATFEFKSGSQPLLDSGATAKITGTVEYQSGGFLHLKSGSSLQTDSGATSTLAGTVNLTNTINISGTTTISGAIVKSGAAAVESIRRANVTATTGTTTFDLTTADEWSIGGATSGFLTGNLIIIPTVAGVPTGYRVRIKRISPIGNNFVNTFTVKIQDGVGHQIVNVPLNGASTAGIEFTADLIFNGSAYEYSSIVQNQFLA